MDTNELIKREYDTLKNYARKLTCNNYDADDLTQETVLRILEKQELVKPEYFLYWAMRVMKNIRLNDIKKNTVRETEDLENLEDNHNLSAPELEIEEEPNLPIILQECFNLWRDGYNYKEIAEKLNIPEGTVKSRLHTAREKWKKFLSE